MTNLFQKSIVGAVILIASATQAQPPRFLVVDSPTARPGEVVWVAVRSHGEDVLAVQADLVIPPEAQVFDEQGEPLCTVNPAIHRAWSFFRFNPQLPTPCAPGIDCDRIRAIIADLTTDILIPFPEGAVLYRCAVRAPQSGTVPIGCVKARTAGYASTQHIITEDNAVECIAGTVQVVAEGCLPGDTNADGAVTVGEVVNTVNASLGGVPVTGAMRELVFVRDKAEAVLGQVMVELNDAGEVTPTDEGQALDTFHYYAARAHDALRSLGEAKGAQLVMRITTGAPAAAPGEKTGGESPSGMP